MVTLEVVEKDKNNIGSHSYYSILLRCLFILKGNKSVTYIYRQSERVGGGVYILK